jgi:phosphoenolpyruvate synthase/pyruvate phosphate dikinase
VDATAVSGALTLAEAAAVGEARVGGKALGLARLVELGLPVPPAVVLPVGWEGGARELSGILAAIGPPVAVRSSAVGEDSADRSAAGQYISILAVCTAAALARAVARCRASADAERVRAYTGGTVAGLAVIVQRQVRATRAGVAFSRDPVSGTEEVVIEAVPGYGEGLVAGLGNPDVYRVADGNVRARRADKRAVTATGRRRPLSPERRLSRTLRDDEALAVADMVRRAEDGFGCPVDVEFCFAGARLWAVQCRPITAGARR